MKLLIDTNIFLDVMLQRQGLYEASAQVLDLSSKQGFELLMPAHAAATILYIVESNRSRDVAAQTLSTCLGIARVAALDEFAILRGITYGFKDIEDSFITAIAEREHADHIVTNNIKDFAKSPVPAITPTELLTRLQQSSST